MDFVKSGLSMDHLYSVLQVNGHDYADIGVDEPDNGLSLRLAEIRKLEDIDYLRKILNKNSASLRATLRLFRKERRHNPMRNLVASNRRKVVENYSSSHVVGQLHRVTLNQEPTYIKPAHGKLHNRLI